MGPRCWKYVDDMTIAESTLRGAASEVQVTLNTLDRWCTENNMRLNINKCHAMRVYFSKTILQPLHLTIGNQVLEQIDSVRVLGVLIQCNLKWEDHIQQVVKKANGRVHMLRQLIPFNLPRCDLITIYIGYIRPLLEYAAPVWHPALTQSQTQQIERVQKRVLRLILGNQYQTYEIATSLAQLETLSDRRKRLCLKFAQSLVKSPQFHHWLPLNNAIPRNLRKRNPFKEVKCKTDRFKNSPIPFFTRLLNTHK